MGTSQSSGGPGGGVPMVPPWTPSPPADSGDAGPRDGGDGETARTGAEGFRSGAGYAAETVSNGCREFRKPELVLENAHHVQARPTWFPC